MLSVNYDKIKLLYGAISPTQKTGIEKLISEFNKRFKDKRWLAYILATVYHETAKKMQPIKEMGGEEYLKKKSYYPYYGRDLCQTTWKVNYERVKKFTGVDVVLNPDLITTVAFEVCIEFMVKGYYTGKKLSDYFNENVNNPIRARRIINGNDKAEQISKYYEIFLSSIVDSNL